jgi:cell division protein FtsN
MTMTFPSRFRQQGNTLTGLIIGLIIGLAIAVVVALAITKGSTPFTDKSGKLGKPAEPTAGQVSDPNKPLYGGKDAALQANKEFQKEGKVIPAAAPAATPATAPVAGAAAAAPAAKAPAPVVAGTAPAGAKPAEPAKPADPAKPAEDKYVYFLQVGEFREAANADNTRAKLALLGYEASVSERTVDNNVLHRVRLGPYPQVDAMNKVRAKLTENGVDVAVVRSPK